MIRRQLHLAGLALMGLVLLLALRIVAGKLAGPFVLARAERLFVRDVGSLEIRDWAPAPPPPEQNAGRRLLEISRRTPEAALGPLYGVRFLDLGGDTPIDPDALRAVVEANRGVLAELRALADLPGSSLGEARELFRDNRLREEIFNNRRAPALPVRLLLAEAHLALREGATSRAVEDLAALRAITLVFRREPLAISHLLARASEERTLALARGLVRLGGAEVATRVAGELQALERAPGARHALAGEALFGREMVRRMADEGVFGGGRKGSASDLFDPFTAEHFAAESLSRVALVVRASEVPAPRWPASWPNPPTRGATLAALLWPLSSVPLVGTSVQTLGFHWLRDEQFILSARRLGRIAAALAEREAGADAALPALASLPGGATPLLWSDELPRLERRSDGGWTVSAPEGIRLVWSEYFEEESLHRAEFEARERLLRWEVPPR